jgi:maltooligosyltrehalose trehalohydrolase
MAKYRQQEFAQVGAAYSPEVLAQMPDPQAEKTFVSAKLDWAERKRLPHAGVLELYRACLRLRAEHTIFQSAARDRWQVEKRGEVGLAVRWNGSGEEWALIVALQPGLEFVVPDDRGGWALILDSNDKRFGGTSATVQGSPGAVLWRRSE